MMADYLRINSVLEMVGISLTSCPVLLKCRRPNQCHVTLQYPVANNELLIK